MDSLGYRTKILMGLEDLPGFKNYEKALEECLEMLKGAALHSDQDYDNYLRKLFLECPDAVAALNAEFKTNENLHWQFHVICDCTILNKCQYFTGLKDSEDFLTGYRIFRKGIAALCGDMQRFPGMFVFLEEFNIKDVYFSIVRINNYFVGRIEKTESELLNKRFQEWKERLINPDTFSLYREDFR